MPIFISTILTLWSSGPTQTFCFSKNLDICCKLTHLSMQRNIHIIIIVKIFNFVSYTTAVSRDVAMGENAPAELTICQVLRLIWLFHDSLNNHSSLTARFYRQNRKGEQEEYNELGLYQIKYFQTKMYVWWDWRRPSCHSWDFLPAQYDILFFFSSCTWGENEAANSIWPH